MSDDGAVPNRPLGGMLASGEGFADEDSGESLERYITSSVVKVSFVVIVAVGLFAMLFAAINYGLLSKGRGFQETCF